MNTTTNNIVKYILAFAVTMLAVFLVNFTIRGFRIADVRIPVVISNTIIINAILYLIHKNKGANTSE